MFSVEYDVKQKDEFVDSMLRLLTFLNLVVQDFRTKIKSSNDGTANERRIGRAR